MAPEADAAAAGGRGQAICVRPPIKQSGATGSPQSVPVAQMPSTVGPVIPPNGDHTLPVDHSGGWVHVDQ